MKFLKSFWNWFTAILCTYFRPLAMVLIPHHYLLTFKNIRLIHCLSKNTPNVMSGTVNPSFHFGVICSEHSKKCMISEQSATFVTSYDVNNPHLPKLVPTRGFKNTLFYPFDELAHVLGYDVFYCSFKDAKSKVYSKHVLFAEHISHGSWIQLSHKNAMKYFGNLYCDELYTDGFAYADCSDSDYYVVQLPGEVVYVPHRDVIFAVETI